MTKHLVDLDEHALEAARHQLGTSTIKDTVNSARRAAVIDRDDHVTRLLASSPRPSWTNGATRGADAPEEASVEGSID